VAVHLGDRLVVDLWAGDGWTRDTIVHTYSVSKPFAAICAVLLWERGALDLDAPVARYWPEFGQAGKERTTVRQLLSHQAGLVALREPLPPEALLDWDRICAALAAEEPWWEPGTAIGEHALFYGHLVGELVRRVDGRPLGRFFAEEVAAPWGLDFHFGLGPAERARCADVLDEGGAFRAGVLADPRPLLVPSLDNPPGALDVAVVNSAAYREALVPAINGHGSARAIARFHATLARGGPGLDEMLRVQAAGHDILLDDERSWGLGLFAREPDGWFGMGGIGGYQGSGRQRDGLAVGYGYVTRVLGTHDRSDACEDALDACLADL
jgi:CubicO group peptidase (beta-lactamase class C family)